MATRSYHATIIKDGTGPMCSICNRYDETIDHIVFGCPGLAGLYSRPIIFKDTTWPRFVYVRRQSQHDNIQVSGKWYEHEPATVTGNEEATLLWNMQIHTDREMADNKPNIVMKDQKNKTCKLIDMTEPWDRNTSGTITEKLSKYKYLDIETTITWGNGNRNNTSRYRCCRTPQ